MGSGASTEVPDKPAPLLDVAGLSVTLERDGRTARLVDNVSFSLVAGEVLCIVGESGCGKTVTARSIIGPVLIRSQCCRSWSCRSFRLSKNQ